MIYSSVDNKKIKDLKKLHTKKHRDETGLFLVEGPHLVLEAYQAKVLEELLVLEDSNFHLDIKTNYLTNSVMKYLSELETPYEVIGICKKQDNNKYGNKIVVLDDVQDPGNLGTIIRSAVAFNIDTIILSNKSVDLYNNKVVRASQGMLFKIDIVVKDLLTEIPKLKQLDYHIYGTKVTGGNCLQKVKPTAKFALIMGNEGSGLKQEVAELCDEFIYITMNEKCESLNVGVATSIILYEFDKEVIS